MENQKQRANSCTGHPGRLVVGRILPASDWVLGIKKICEDNNVKGGNVVSCIGALQEANILNPLPLDAQGSPTQQEAEGEERAGYAPPLTIPGPIQVLSCQGTICTKEDGELVVHLHGLVADSNHRIYGGHIPAGKNPISNTMEVMIAEIADVKMLLKYDPETKEPHFSPEK